MFSRAEDEAGGGHRSDEFSNFPGEIRANSANVPGAPASGPPKFMPSVNSLRGSLAG